MSAEQNRFFSDNAARVHPKIWEAVRDADALDTAYDGDALSAKLDAVFCDLFGQDCAAIWVSTGTAANALSLAALCPPYGGILCHEEAHIAEDECAAVEFYSGGAKLLTVPGEGGKLTVDAIRTRVASIRADVHQVQPRALSLTNSTEYGRVYSAEEVQALASFAHEKGWRVHMDGARFANAVASLGCSPGAISGQAGVEALSFGCVKNGGMNAEAIILFDRDLAEEIRIRRKRAGHLLSKGRYLAAQLLAMIEGDLWLDNARAANAAAQILAKAAGDRLMHLVEANELFIRVSEDEAAKLRATGYDFYDWGPYDAEGQGAIRLVTSWHHGEDDVMPLANAMAALA